MISLAIFEEKVVINFRRVNKSWKVSMINKIFSSGSLPVRQLPAWKTINASQSSSSKKMNAVSSTKTSKDWAHLFFQSLYCAVKVCIPVIVNFFPANEVRLPQIPPGTPHVRIQKGPLASAVTRSIGLESVRKTVSGSST